MDWVFAAVIVGIHSKGDTYLVLVAHTLRPLRLGFGARECWQKEGRQTCDNRDIDEQLDERKRSISQSAKRVESSQIHIARDNQVSTSDWTSSSREWATTLNNRFCFFSY